MNLKLSFPGDKVLNSTINITGSKSESNRLLLLKAQYPGLSIKNCSNSDDARVMEKGLLAESAEVDIHHAGTAMRFLTAYFAAREGKKVILTGSSRMQQRPIKVLVEALRHLGAKIRYLKNEGCPPLEITGARLAGNQLSLPADISSQYISALLLIAPSLENGLNLELLGKITSEPYIRMTLSLLGQIGVSYTFEGNRISINPLESIAEKTVVVESDWSSASYYYSILALSAAGSTLRLSSYRKNSLQGDSVLSEIYKDLGVETEFSGHSIILSKISRHLPASMELDLTHAPDLAQTVAVSCFGLGIACHLTGLHTLKIKETDRLEALYTELSKLGAAISVTDRSLRLGSSEKINRNIAIDTYNDHRMAMSFAPLALRTPIIIKDAGVVSKSYPDFWRDLESLSFEIKEV